MIVIHNFKEAHHLYQQGSIPFRLLQEQAMVLIGFNSGHHVEDAFDICNSDIEWLLQQPEEDYNGMLGGDVHVCESEADLLEVVGIDMEFAAAHDNRWPDVTDQVMSWDQCAYLKQKDGDPEWALFLLCWNDAGGNNRGQTPINRPSPLSPQPTEGAANQNPASHKEAGFFLACFSRSFVGHRCPTYNPALR